MKQVLTFGKIAYSGKAKTNLVEISIEIKNKEKAIDYETLKEVYNVPELSICGGIWNSRKTDYEICGQCLDTIKAVLPHNKKIARIVELWNEYHLNDLNPGTKNQCEAINKWRKENNLKGWLYDEEKTYLDSIGLLNDNGIIWGCQWLYRPLPIEVINELTNLN